MAEVTANQRRTALANEHIGLGAKMVDFSGWFMPVSYSSVLKEHAAVRTSVGLFDVSHMGEARVAGKGARNFLQFVAINNIDKLAIGGGQYSAILNDEGGFVDDLIVYRTGPEEYFLCLNASNAAKDIQWLKKVSGDFDVKITDECEQWSQIAVQGPESQKALSKAFSQFEKPEFTNMAYMTIVSADLFGKKSFIARTGYTGEHGYEIYLPNEVAAKVWQALLAVDLGNGQKVIPCGLGARDTLRLEACYLLYGNDMDHTVNPIEAGIKWATKVNGPDFIGKSKLDSDIKSGPKRKIFAFVMEEDGIPRHGMEVYHHDQHIGQVTSGSVLPTVGGAGGMALLSKPELKIGDQVTIDIRGKRKLARLARRPLYNPNVN